MLITVWGDRQRLFIPLLTGQKGTSGSLKYRWKIKTTRAERKVHIEPFTGCGNSNKRDEFTTYPNLIRSWKIFPSRTSSFMSHQNSPELPGFHIRLKRTTVYSLRPLGTSLSLRSCLYILVYLPEPMVSGRWLLPWPSEGLFSMRKL